MRASASRSSGRIVDVAVESALARLGDDLALLAHLPVVFEVGAAAQFTAVVGPEALDQRRLGCSGQLAQRAQTHRLEPRGRLRPDPGDQPGRRAGEALTRLLARQHDKSRRLLRVGGDLRDQLVRPDPHRADELRRGLDVGQHAAHGRARRIQTAQVEVGLVEAHHLDALHVRAHDAHHAFGDLAVVRPVGRYEHRLRAEPARTRSRHRRAHAEAPRLIAGGGHHRPRPGARHDDRQPAQLRPAVQLDRDIEGVGVEVGYARLDALDGRLSNAVGNLGSRNWHLSANLALRRERISTRLRWSSFPRGARESMSLSPSRARRQSARFVTMASDLCQGVDVQAHVVHDDRLSDRLEGVVHEPLAQLLGQRCTCGPSTIVERNSRGCSGSRGAGCSQHSAEAKPADSSRSWVCSAPA